MAKRKRKTSAARVVTGLAVIYRQDDVLEPVYEADPDGRPVVHHRTVDTLGIMLRAGTITKDMHDAARDFQAQFTIGCYDTLVSLRFRRDPSRGSRAELTETQIDARRRVDEATRSAGSAVRPAAACGMSSGCSTRSASGRCGKAGAAGQSASSRRRAFWWRV